MQMLFLPVCYQFFEMFDKVASEENPPEDFFQHPVINNELLKFFQDLPSELTNFLTLLHELIIQEEGSEEINLKSKPLLTLLINRLLFNLPLKKILDRDFDGKSFYIDASNNFQDLFYSKNIEKKYKNIPNYVELSSKYIKAFEQVNVLFFLKF